MVTRLLASDRGRLAAILAVLLVVIAGLALIIAEREMRATDADAVMAGESSIVILAGPGLSGFQVLIDPTQATAGAAADSRVEALFVLWLLLVPIAGVVGWRIAGRIVGPVNAAIAVATVAGPGHLSARIPTPARPQGSWRLATAVNGLLERFERREADRRRLVDDAAHEMRNPLAVMQTSLELALADPGDPEGLRSAAAISQRAARRIAQTIDVLQEEFRDHAPQARRTVVDLSDVIREIGRDYSAVAARRGIAVHVSGGDGLTVVADRDALRRALDNLMANALRLAPAGSPVIVGAGATQGWRWFGVRDFGPGIAVADQPFVFARGWHGGDAVDGAGSGIGLALVRQIAEAQGGTVRLSSVPRGGSSFLIWLPAGDGHAAAPLGPDLAVDPLWFPASLAAPTRGPGPLGGDRPTSPPMPFPAQA